ncbi:DUF3089 domain-containing protein [Sulfitobacter aestuariivivens]|uniref:DUF3089 domain-containing protein n=1 Tax=Sulfitobacter aestuariivivens TaxID=2766981 RepID=A0A927D6Y7_9RHOB|nr:DUF3089 domain-containing protein [Sulfitobacter aestuariivivens]MBD3666064.1 DUF3089 domain-containing protein [Sulfitobacter aestuariivivens]
MTKWLFRIGLVLVILFGLASLFRNEVWYLGARLLIKPSQEFFQSSTPAAPDYTRNAAWAAHPDTDDNADFVPPGLPAVDEPRQVAAFYVHPTTYISGAGWNAPLDDPDASQWRDGSLLLAQASAFNACCTVFAPKYRQATFWVFIDDAPSATAALDLAYRDVATAFDQFLTEIDGAPFILAGHSQGAQHLMTLLTNRFSTGPLRDRLVAAYAIGLPTRGILGATQAIPLCQTATETGCYVAWNAMGSDGQMAEIDRPRPCVNPLSWQPNGARVPASENLGALSVTGEITLTPAFASAQCHADRLEVGPFASNIFDDVPLRLGKDNYHVLDYSLFYANIRQNAVDRSKAFIASQSQTADTD